MAITRQSRSRNPSGEGGRKRAPEAGPRGEPNAAALPILPAHKGDAFQVWIRPHDEYDQN
jgi:hypothetical protein